MSNLDFRLRVHLFHLGIVIVCNKIQLLILMHFDAYL